MISLNGLPLDNPKWANLKTGFDCVFDPRPAIVPLVTSANTQEHLELIFGKLGEEICNQGVIGDCEKALIPWLLYITSRSPWSFFATSFILDLILWRTRNPSGDLEIENFCDEAIENLSSWIVSVFPQDLDSKSYLLRQCAEELYKDNVKHAWTLFDSAVE